MKAIGYYKYIIETNPVDLAKTSITYTWFYNFKGERVNKIGLYINEALYLEKIKNKKI